MDAANPTKSVRNTLVSDFRFRPRVQPDSYSAAGLTSPIAPKGGSIARVIRTGFCFLAFALLLAGNCALAQTTSPRIFFTDLQSGPNTGGENNKGAYITIWGSGFGTSQGSSTVTIGGGAVDHCPIWGATWLWYQKITCQLGSAVSTGAIVVTVGGTASTCGSDLGCAFTVRSGNIFFVSTNGNNNNNGSFSSPWAKVTKAKNSLAAGDIAYIENGVSQTTVDDYNACLSISSAGSAGNPKALIAYPGATVTVGSSSCQYAIRTPSISGGPFAYWVISGLNIFGGGNQSLDLTSTNNWQVVGNDMTCPNSPGGQAACWETSATADHIYAYGNHLHSFPSGDKQYHGFYFSDNVNDTWVGWNSIHDGGCRGIQFHSTGHPNLFDLHVHDNLVYNIRCDGINMATIAPQNGTVEVYNNVVFHTGLGPDYSTQGPSSYTCIASPGITNAGSPGTGTAYFYNNTLYDCSSRSTSGGRTTQGAISVDSGSPNVQINNNIIQTIPSDTGGYLSPDSSTSLVSGSNNLCFGSGPCPSSFGSNNLSSDPLLVSIGPLGFALQTLSPAIGAGTNSKKSAAAIDGKLRPTPPSIGAYEGGSGVVATKPNPPTSVVLSSVQ